MNGVLCIGDMALVADPNYRIARVVALKEFIPGVPFVGVRTRPNDLQPIVWIPRSEVLGRIGVWGE